MVNSDKVLIRKTTNFASKDFWLKTKRYFWRLTKLGLILLFLACPITSFLCLSRVGLHFIIMYVYLSWSSRKSARENYSALTNAAFSTTNFWVFTCYLALPSIVAITVIKWKACSREAWDPKLGTACGLEMTMKVQANAGYWPLCNSEKLSTWNGKWSADI